MIKYVLYGSNHANLFKQIEALPPTIKYAVTVKEYKSQRSLEQNRWARKFAADFSKQFGYSPDEAYDILMYKCNPVFKTDLDGNEIRLPGHLSNLNTAEAAEVQERMIKFGLDVGFMWEGE